MDDKLEHCRNCGAYIDAGRLKFCDEDCRTTYQKLSKGRPEVRYESLKRVMAKEKIPYSDPLWKPSIYFDVIKDGNARCVYCDGPLSRSGHGLDRKVSSLGHRFDNCVPACGFCNMLRGPRGAQNRGKDSISYEEMVTYLKPGLTEMREAREMATPKRK